MEVRIKSRDSGNERQGKMNEKTKELPTEQEERRTTEIETLNYNKNGAEKQQEKSVTTFPRPRDLLTVLCQFIRMSVSICFAKYSILSQLIHHICCFLYQQTAFTAHTITFYQGTASELRSLCNHYITYVLLCNV
jgi:hypothetical protein